MDLSPLHSDSTQGLGAANGAEHSSELNTSSGLEQLCLMSCVADW